MQHCPVCCYSTPSNAGCTTSICASDTAIFVTRLLSLLLQNPVTTACWLSAVHQLMVMPISLIIDVKPFCEPPFRSKPFLLTTLTYRTLSILGIIVGPTRRANIFELYLFPESFRVKSTDTTAVSSS